jgi:hypothetical protein
LREVLLFPEKAASVGKKAELDMRRNFSAQAISGLAEKALQEIGVKNMRAVKRTASSLLTP